MSGEGVVVGAACGTSVSVCVYACVLGRRSGWDKQMEEGSWGRHVKPLSVCICVCWGGGVKLG